MVWRWNEAVRMGAHPEGQQKCSTRKAGTWPAILCPGAPYHHEHLVVLGGIVCATVKQTGPLSTFLTDGLFLGESRAHRLMVSTCKWKWDDEITWLLTNSSSLASRCLYKRWSNHIERYYIGQINQTDILSSCMVWIDGLPHGQTPWLQSWPTSRLQLCYVADI